jgi:hypothetical protein
MTKSINHKGAQALINSPVGYFSAEARLPHWRLLKVHKGLKFITFIFVPFVPSWCSLWLKKSSWNAI